MSQYRIWQRLCSLVVLAGLALSTAPPAHIQASAPQQPGSPTPVIGRALKFGLSPALSSIPRQPAEKNIDDSAFIGGLPIPRKSAARDPNWRDPLLRGPSVINAMPAPIANFEGASDDDNETYAGGRVVPPDTNGDIGYDPAAQKKYYVQWINLVMEIWDVTDPLNPVGVYGPAAGNALWTGFGGDCETHNDGDPIVLFDAQANRWLASQFALFGSDGGHHECIAISQTADPTGAWYLYDFLVSPTKINDYPKFGVWPDGYYMSVNQFDENTFAWGGAGVVAFDRDAMLIGDPNAQMIYFDLFGVDPNLGGLLPSDLDGLTPPPAGAPNYFMNFDDDAWGYSPDQLQLWAFHADWDTPANSIFTNVTIFDLTALGYPFASVCNDFFRGQCITQPSPGEVLESLGDRLMHRLAYRNYGGYESLVVNHSVDVDGNDHSGIRWYEIRNPSATPIIYQAGTYGPDADHRWMGSIAMDHVGNLAVGYSVSGDSTYPSVRYAGRLAGDPLGDLTQGEAELFPGGGAQTGSFSRWGDYSMMGVDPVDDCTFWYTQEYYAATGSFDFTTRIGSFKFPNCSIGPQGTLSGTVTNINTSAPIAGAQIQAQLSPTQTFGTTTDAGGEYEVNLPIGVYTVTASAYGYTATTVSGVNILSGTVTVQDFALAPKPPAVAQGVVTDGSSHTGMPLYAKIRVTAPGYAADFYTNPGTGAYSATLILNQPYSFTVTAVGGGYNPAVASVTPSANPHTRNFALTVDTAACAAPGYVLNVAGILETFDGTTIPAGWTTIDNTGGGDWAFDDPGGRGNLTPGGETNFAVIDSDFYGSSATQDAELRTPVLNFTGVSTVAVEFDTDLNIYDFGLSEIADVDVSTNGGTTWTNVWRWEQADGDLNDHVSVDISSLAGNQSNVKVRFHYYDANYEWWWEVDDVLVGNASCGPVAGGRIVGSVYDANTGDALNGATVSNSTGTVTTFATPADPAVDDGFYITFGSGAISTTASAPEYGGVSVNVSTVSNNTVVRNFNLPAGLLSTSPTSAEVSLMLGLSTTVPLTLTNGGGASATFEFREGRSNFIPLGPRPGRVIYGKRPSAVPDAIHNGSLSPKTVARRNYTYLTNQPFDLDIIVYADDSEHTPTAVEVALQDLGLSYTFYGNDFTGANLSAFVADVNDGAGAGDPWELVILAADSWALIDASEYTALQNHILSGGKAIVQSWAIGYASAQSDHPLWALMGGTFNNWITSPNNLYWWDDGHPIFEGVPEFTDLTNLGFLAYGASLTLNGAAEEGLGGFATVPTAGEAGVILNNDNTTLYKGLTDNLNDGDVDSDTVPDRDEWWTNAIGFILNPVVDVTWLTETPISGTVAATNTQPIALKFDAGVPEVSQPGIYSTMVTVKENTPYDAPTFPATLTVTAPPTWGKLAGAVTGLLHCDAPGAALEGATVFIEGSGSYTATTETNATGAYTWWLDQANSPLTVTISANGYVAQTFGGLNVSAGVTTTRNADLRLNVPCVTATADTLSQTVSLGTNATVTLNLTNTGAGSTTFQLREADGGFTANLIGPYGPARYGAGQGAPVRRISGAFFSGSLAVYQAANGESRPGAGRNSPADAPWTDIADYPVSIMDNTAAEIDDLIYSVGGYDGIDITAAAYVYDPEADAWTAIASMSEAREKPAAAALDGLLYVVGGWDPFGTPVTTLEIYDPNSDTWTTGADIPTAYAAAAMVALDGQLYVIGGCDSSSCGFADVFVYDPGSDTWSTAADYPEATSWLACGAIDGQIYCAGGTAGFSELDTTYVYDSGSDSWTQLADMMQTQWGMGFVAVEGQLYISGGVTDNFSTVTNEGFVYDPDSDTWTAIENSNNTLYRGASACGWHKVGGSIGGFSPVPDSEVYPGLDNCAGGGDMVWLTEDPVTGTLPAPSTQAVNVTFDAGQAQQPGTHMGALSVKSGDPVSGTYAFPVTMTVPVPAGWGQGHGWVYGLGYCDGNPVLLEDATINITTSAGVTATLTQGSDAPWSWWAPAGPLVVTASFNGYLTQTVVLNILPGEGINHDLYLRLEHSCIQTSPASVALTLEPGVTATAPINIVNTGVLPVMWSLSETSSWLSITGAVTGTTGADSSTATELTVDTTGMAFGGMYTAIVNVDHDDDLATDPLPLIIRVTMPIKMYLPLILR